MIVLLAIFAGAIQGITEFLPISSTGHLIIFENIFGISQEKFGLTFDASLHLGTLGAILIFFWRDYFKILTQKNKLFGSLIIGTIPAAILGLIFEGQIESTARQVPLVAVVLIIFSAVFVLAEKIGQKKKSLHDLSLKDGFLIGLFQAIALIPGVSRSGSTISAGLILGFKRAEAARFAFVLSGPILAAAGFRKFLEVIKTPSITGDDFNFFLVGMVSSAIFGYLTIKYFLKYLSSKTLYPFVIYRVVVGLILLVATL